MQKGNKIHQDGWGYGKGHQGGKAGHAGRDRHSSKGASSRASSGGKGHGASTRAFSRGSGKLPIGADPKAVSPPPTKKKCITHPTQAASPPDNKQITPTLPPARMPYKDFRLQGNAAVGGSSSAASPPVPINIPEDAKAHWQLGWLTTFEDIEPELQNKIITSWRNSKVSIFPPSDRHGDSDLFLAMVALKDCKQGNYPNQELWSEAKALLRELPGDHKSLRTLSWGWRGDKLVRGYPSNTLPIHLICQTNLRHCVPTGELKDFYDEIAYKSRMAIDQRQGFSAADRCGASGQPSPLRGTAPPRCR